MSARSDGAGVIDLTRHLAELDGMVERLNAALLILDPVVATMPAGKVNAHRDQDVRFVLAPLAALAEDRGCAVLANMHFRKAPDDALMGVSGSIGFVGTARSLLVFGADPNDDRGEEGPARVLAHAKCNVGPRQASLSCVVEQRDVPHDDRVIRTSRLVIGEAIEVRADDLVRPRAGEHRSEREEAAEFLRDYLVDGRQKAKDVQDAAAAAGIAYRTLRRAQASLGIEPYQEGRAWWWELPATGDDGEPDSADSESGVLTSDLDS